MMHRWAWAVCLLGALPVLAAEAPPGAPERQSLTRFVRQECGFCHGLRLTGGLGAPLTVDRMRERPLDYLQSVILHGIPGTAMPGWSAFLTPQQVQWIAERLREGFPE